MAMLLARLALAALLLAAPAAAGAQGTRVPRVGLVAATSPAAARHQVDAFREGLRTLGHVEGQTIVVEERWGEGSPERFAGQIADLLRSRVDVLVVASAVGARAAKAAATATPVVFLAVTDPIGSGVVSSLARPGGNMTGTSLVIGEEIVGKWVDLVKDALPAVSSLAALSHPDHPVNRAYVDGLAAAARARGLRLQVVDVRDAPDLDRALLRVAQGRPGALVVTASPLFGANRKRIADFALRHRIPSVGHYREMAADGMLMSYGASITDAYRRGAVYVDRILKGARPADLPVEQPTTFELVINLRTARALRLAIPPGLLGRADHLIE